MRHSSSCTYWPCGLGGADFRFGAVTVYMVGSAMDTGQLEAGEMKLQNVCELWGEGLSFFFLDALRAEDIGFKMQKSILLSGSHK